MGDNDRIFKPRRGTKTTFSSTKANTILSEGEIFFEVPDTGQGTGRVRVKMGDGITEYSSLPYAIPFTEDEIIIHDGTDTKSITASSSIQSNSIATNLNNAKSGNTLKSIIHNLREAIYKCACDISFLDSNKQVAGSYAAANHNHSGVYQPAGSYAAANHNHSGVYQPVGSYAAANHNHDNRYFTYSDIALFRYPTQVIANPTAQTNWVCVANIGNWQPLTYEVHTQWAGNVILDIENASYDIGNFYCVGNVTSRLAGNNFTIYITATAVCLNISGGKSGITKQGDWRY